MRVTAADLAPLLQIKAGDPFVEARVGLIGAAITELYRVRGFAQAVVKPNIQVLPPRHGANVTFRPVAIRFEIQEGPQTIVSGVEFAGTAAIPADRLRAQMALQGGKPFYRPQLSVDRDTLERAYRNQGFQSVSVISQLAFANDQQLVAITWTVREGEQIKVDRVLINGNARISTQLIRRELTIQPGDPMSDEAMLESQRKLAALGLFRRVRITELPRTGSLTRDVLVDLEEAETTTIDYGGGFEVGRIAATARRWQRRDRRARLRPARLLRDQPPQPVGQEPIGHAVRPRHAAARGRRSGPIRPMTAATASTTTAACSPSASRARSARPATRSSPPSSSRAGVRASASTAAA